MTTLQNLITLLRQRTNTEVNQFVTDAELTTYLNNSLCLLDGILISKFNDYKLSQTITTLATDQDYLELPADFLKLRGLDVQLSTTDYQQLNPFSFKQRNKRLFSSGPIDLEYRLAGSHIILQPKDLAIQYNYRLWYTPDYIPLVNLTDTLETYMDSQAWYEYAVVNSAIKVLAKQNMDPSTFMAQAAELKDHIERLSAPNRDAGEPASIIDSRSGDTGWNW